MIEHALLAAFFIFAFGLVVGLWWGFRHWGVGIFATGFGLVLGVSALVGFGVIDLFADKILDWGPVGSSRLRSYLALAAGLICSGLSTAAISRHHSAWPGSRQRDDG